MIGRTKKKAGALFLALVMTMSLFDSFGMVQTADAKSTSMAVASESYYVTGGSYDEHATGFLGVNRSSVYEDMSITQDEFEEMYDDEEIFSDSNSGPKMAVKGTYPSAVDNSNSKDFPAIGNQQQVGSCVCWAEVYYAFTYANCKAKDVPATGKNIMSPAFVYNQVKYTGGGTWSSAAINVLMTEGVPSFSSADFETYYNEEGNKTWFPSKTIWQEAEKNRLTSYVHLSDPAQITSPYDNDIDDMKKYLSEGYLITFGSMVDGWEYVRIPSGSSHSGEWIVKSARNAQGGHQMTIVGYDDNIYYDINGDGTIQDAERGAFKIANSWGTTYKNKGFIWVSYDSLNARSAVLSSNSNRIASMSDFYVQYVEAGGTKGSGVDLVLNLNTATRNQDRIEVIAKNSSNKTYKAVFTATNEHNYYSYSLDGKTYASDGIVTFDLNNVISNITPQTVGNYTWYVNVKDTKKDSKTLKLNDAYIESDGVMLAKYNGNAVSVDSSNQTIELSGVKAKTLSAGWDLGQNQSTVGIKRTISAGLTSATNATYKFVQTYNGKSEVLKNYSSDNTVNFVPELAGKYTITVSAKDSGDNKEYVTNLEFVINDLPQVSSVKYNTTSFKVNSPVAFSASFTGGTGTKKLVSAYSIGGNYNSPKTTNLTISGTNTATWTPTMDGSYTIYATVADELGATSQSLIGTINVSKDAVSDFSVSSFTSSAKSGVSILEGTTLSAVAAGGSGDYSYRFGIINNGKEYEFTNGYVSSGSVKADFTKVTSGGKNVILAGTNTLFVDVRDDVSNQVIRKTISDFGIEGLKVKFSASADNGKFVTGKTISLKAEVENEVISSNNVRKFLYSYNGSDFKEISASDATYALNVVANTEGNYEFKYEITDAIGQKASVTTKVYVSKEADNTNNKVVIYYNNSSWRNANIYYRVDNGKWTNSPGITMKASDRAGYKWMYVIDLGEGSSATACFTNGWFSWDTASGYYYTMKAGTYGISNGRIVSLS